MFEENEIIVFGYNLKKIRMDNGLSKVKMAQRIGIGIKSLIMLEKGILPPRLGASVLIGIYREFGVLPSEMFMSDKKVKEPID